MSKHHRAPAPHSAGSSAGSSTSTADTPGSAASLPHEPAARTQQPCRHTRRNFLLGGAAVLGLTATGTSAWALNRFVIDHTEITDVEAYEAQNADRKSVV